MTYHNSDIQKFMPLCPLCKGYTFTQHWMSEYSHEWNKCQSCGYMELKATSLKRILSKLDPEGLNEQFVDPVTDEIIKSAVNIGIYSNRKKEN
jgi:Zn ribbon nucleic-acid-binding protein